MNEYEAKSDKNLKIIIAVLIGSNLLTFIIKLDTLSGFQSIASICMFAYTMYYIFKNNSDDSFVIVKRIRNRWKKEHDKILDIREWNSGEMGGLLYFYFPREGFGFEYNLNKDRIGSKQLRTVVNWERSKIESKIMSELVNEQIKENKKDEFMDSKGFSRKEN